MSKQILKISLSFLFVVSSCASCLCRCFPCLVTRVYDKEPGNPEVPASGREHLETAETAGSNQDCYTSENPTKCSNKHRLSAYGGLSAFVM